MAFFRKQTTDNNPQKTYGYDQALSDLKETQARLVDDRNFWDNAVLYLITDGMSTPELERAMAHADRLLEERRERFPL